MAEQTLARITPTPMAANAQQGDKKRQIVLIARELNQVGWGNQGNITGMIEEVDIDKLWPNPMHPVEHSDLEIDDMKESLQVEGQKDPLVVAYALAPSDSEDYAGNPLLIVDGHLRYYGRLRQGKDTIKVIVQPFISLTEVMLETASRALNRHIPTPLEVGRYIMRVRLAHEIDKAQNPNTAAFPTLEDLSRRFGKSKGTISEWLKLAMQPPDFVALVDNGQLGQTQALEILRLPNEQDRVQMAMRVSQRFPAQEVEPDTTSVREERSGPAITASVRQRVDAQKRRVMIDDSPLAFQELWMKDINEATPTPLALAYLTRDLAYLLLKQTDDMKQAGEAIHPALTRLQRALLDPALQDFIHASRSKE